jgi:hypothetical protein
MDTAACTKVGVILSEAKNPCILFGAARILADHLDFMCKLGKSSAVP